MARNRDTTTPKKSTAPRDPQRRSLITLGVPALGALGLAGLLQRPQAAAGATAEDPTAKDADASEMTPHRDAYYRRARF